jgi:pre-rRNA-processing protein RIX1
MAPLRPDDLQTSSLRSIIFRLTSTPVHQLPQIVPHLAHQLVSCRQFLSQAQDTISKDNAALIHSFKTRLSSLLQDRTVEGRWSAVVLIKATIELSGSEVLYGDKDKVSAWIRGLIGILNKPDPSTTKQLCIITLTRTFMLTREYPTLLRELTTPCLPSFVNACLNQFQGKELGYTAVQRALLAPVLESISVLLPRHPAIFRPFENQLRELGLHILSLDVFQLQSKYSAPNELRRIAQRLLALLPACVPKGGSAEKLDGLIRETVKYIHAAADQVFRAVNEDWESTCSVRSTLEGQPLSDQPEQEASGANKEWTGIRSGSERIASHLGFLKHCILTSTSSAIPLRIGVLADLLTRLMYLQVSKGDSGSSRFNPQVSRQEREELWIVLPSIHIASIELFVALVERLKTASAPVCQQFLELLPWLFEAEHSDISLRAAMYRAVAIILPTLGPSSSKSTVSSLNNIVKSCCTDLLPVAKEQDPAQPAAKQQNGQTHTTNGIKSTAKAEAAMNTSASIITTPTQYAGLRAAASDLLPILLSTLPASHISIPIRTEMDRVAVLVRHRDALTASTLNPAPHKQSLLPILASLEPASLATEGLLRPRMPTIRIEERDDAMVEAIEEVVERRGLSFNASVEDLEITPPQAFDWNSLNAPVNPAAGSMGQAMAKMETRTSKRQQVGEKEEEEVTSPTKRARLEEMKEVQSVVHTATSEQATVISTFKSEDVTVVGATAGEEESGSDGDDDGSDFEIPALVMQVDSEEEEEEDEGED